ncbi:MAG: TAXI family TRAP transporter solute-binding subunit [Bacillaceae bacterium]|nr:TAXI family TRAP transporter solute-binding subunit [Bacillaceae bacterium]
MKKSFMLLLTFLLAFSVLAACGQGGGEQPAEENTGEQGENQEQAEGTETQYNWLMATGGTGGTYYPLGGAMAEVWNDNIEGLNVTVQSTGASVENIRLLAGGETELAMAMNGPAQAAVQGGTDDFPEALENFAAVGVIYPEVMQIIAPKDSGIETVADLKGKRVSIGPSGSGTAAAAVKILEAYGIDPDNDIEKFQDTFSDAATKIKDGNLDAAFAVLAVPAANVVDITTATPVTIVDISGEGLDKLLEADSSFSAYTIPGGTYKGQDEDAQTVSQWAVLYVQKDLPEDVIYEITRVMYENTDQIAQGHARGDQITLDNAIKGIAPVPFHPGAEKYYQEKGILD